MDKLDFSYNWNNKLRCRCFTTLRLRNDEKYYKGARFEVSMSGYPKGKAKVVDIKIIKLNQINEWIARLDTGYSARETKDILKKMYKNKPYINWDTQELSYALLAWENQEKMQSLFEENE
ncbi:MAG: ASCH domain-containing protein [Dysgonomonas sp.]